MNYEALEKFGYGVVITFCVGWFVAKKIWPAHVAQIRETQEILKNQLKIQQTQNEGYLSAFSELTETTRRRDAAFEAMAEAVRDIAVHVGHKKLRSTRGGKKP